MFTSVIYAHNIKLNQHLSCAMLRHIGSLRSIPRPGLSSYGYTHLARDIYISQWKERGRQTDKVSPHGGVHSVSEYNRYPAG